MNRITPMLLSIASGCLLSLPWMTASFSWVLLLAFIPLLWAEEMISRHRDRYPGYQMVLCFLTAFLTWNLLSTWWIAYVSLSGMLAIAFINAFLMASCWWIMHTIHHKAGTRTAYFALAVIWIAFETFHFHWTIQWPWLTLGNGFASAPQWVQWYELTGVTGGSLWILLVNLLLFSGIKSFMNSRFQNILQPIIWLLLLVILPAGTSLYRYKTYIEKGETREVVLLQPNVDPYTDKFSGMSNTEQTLRLTSLARRAIAPSTVWIVAPETALAPMWENDSLRIDKALQPLDSLVKEHPQVAIMAGAITQRMVREGESLSYTARPHEWGGYYEVFNSALFMDHSDTVQLGHKNILVSGVEKMPFQKYFSFLGNYIIDAGGMSGSLSAAKVPTIFKGQKGEGIGSVICFESAFAPYVASMVRKGAQVLFIITNDGWWKTSPGIRQHFDYARLRAIETRRSIARSANTGISGFINQRGEVVQQTSVNTTTAISASLHLNNHLTFFVRHGNWLGNMSIAMVVLMLVYYLVKRESFK